MIVSMDESTGRVMVLASKRGFPGAVRIGGVWSEKGIFSADDLKDNFSPVNDPNEAETLFQEAVAALSSNPNL